MADYSPTSGLGQAAAKLRRMVALSSTYQAKLGSGDQYTKALSRVMYEGIPDANLSNAENTDELDSNYPFASIWPHASGWDMVSGGARVFMRPRAELHLYLMCPRDCARDWNNARLAAIDFLENWTKDITDLSGADDASPVITGEGHLAINTIECPMHDHTPKELQKSTEDFFFRHQIIRYGDMAGGV